MDASASLSEDTESTVIDVMVCSFCMITSWWFSALSAFFYSIHKSFRNCKSFFRKKVSCRVTSVAMFFLGNPTIVFMPGIWYTMRNDAFLPFDSSLGARYDMESTDKNILKELKEIKSDREMKDIVDKIIDLQRQKVTPDR